jgi:lysophospholipase L1-like esterase
MPAFDEPLLRFCHPERILATTRLPGLDVLDAGVLAGLYGVDPAVHARTRARWQREAEHAVEAALDDELARGLRSLPFRPGDRVLAVGDSITADRQSGALARSRTLRAARPDHVLVLLGTNDARRHGGVVLVSHRETARNLIGLRRVLGGAPITWITPPPICPERVVRDPLLREADLEWRLPEVAVKRRLVRRQPGPVVDLWPAFGVPARPELMLADGLHPSLAGQVEIVRAISRTAARGR